MSNIQVIVEVPVIDDGRVEDFSVVANDLVCLLGNHTRCLAVLRVDLTHIQATLDDK